MASINYAAREISVKVVYYGPGLSGKTTNLQVIHRKVPPEYKSDMVSLATETDRTLFFDFLPLDLGKIKGFATKFQLYTVPGQVYYNATRKLVLRGVDGIVFVADSAPDKMQENIESFQNLEENLAEYGYKRENIPIIIQYNKRDLPNAMAVEELQRIVNKYNLPWTEAVANKGKGVFDSLKLIGKIVIDHLNKKYSRQSRPATAMNQMAGSASAAPSSYQQMPRQQPFTPATQSPLLETNLVHISKNQLSLLHIGQCVLLLHHKCQRIDHLNCLRWFLRNQVSGKCRHNFSKCHHGVRLRFPLCRCHVQTSNNSSLPIK